MADIVVLGTGTFARLARRYIEGETDDRVVSFTVHERFLDEPSCDALPVVPFEALRELHSPDDVKILVGVGYNRVSRNRSQMFDEVVDAGYELAGFTSPRAQIWPGTEIGEGCFIFEGVTVQPGVEIARGTIIWTGTAVNHDSVVGEFCFLASNAVLSGHVHLGAHTFVGANATFRDGVSTGRYSVIGAGAVITRDTIERSIHSVRGTPPRGDDSFDLDRL